MLARLQRGLEALYRIDTNVRVDDFVIDDDARRQLGAKRAPREQLFIDESTDEIGIGLFVDSSSLKNLEQNDPTDGLHPGNMQDFLFAVEGVSHFVYLVWRAGADRQVSALELELQAEVDKYVTCLLSGKGDASHSDRLRKRLFRDFDYEPDLDPEERDRYKVANSNADAYSRSLEKRFVRQRRTCDMLGELRRFYRMSLAAKLDFIRSAA